MDYIDILRDWERTVANVAIYDNIDVLFPAYGFVRMQAGGPKDHWASPLKIDLSRPKTPSREKTVVGVDDALQIATSVYYGRTDGNGRPVITDILSEALKEPDEDGISRVLLKDIIGMGGYSAGELRERGFSEVFVDSLLSD